MNSDFNINGSSLEQLCEQLKSGELPLEEYILNSLQKVDASEDSIQALLPEPHRKQRLLAEARQLELKYPDPATRPPLYGILIGVKDLFNVDGMPTQAGSQIPAEAFRGKEAVLVTKLKELGAMVLGKTVSTEFAYFFPGNTRNPLNPEYSPGGSSSGSAAAVAAGYCPVAIGTQTIASIIRPASYCGICGYKPTLGLVPLLGVFPFAGSGDAAGLFAPRLHVIHTTAIKLGIVSQGDALDVKKDICFAVVKGDFLQQAEPDVRQNFAKTLAKLIEHGYRYQEVDLFPDLKSVIQDYQSLIAAEFSRNHSALYEKYSHLYSEHSAQLYLKGKSISDEEITLLQGKQMELKERIEKAMKDLDCQVILSPSTTSTAPLGIKSTGSPLMSLPFTAAGMPCVTIPSGFNEHGLAYGLQLIAAQGQDSCLLSVADELDFALKGLNP